MNMLHFKYLEMQKVLSFVFKTNVIATVGRPNVLDYSCFLIIPKSTVVGLARLFWKILQDVLYNITYFFTKISTKSIYCYDRFQVLNIYHKTKRNHS